MSGGRRPADTYLDDLDDVSRPGGAGVEGDLGALGGQSDHGCLHPRLPEQVRLDRVYAGGARHAANLRKRTGLISDTTHTHSAEVGQIEEAGDDNQPRRGEHI